MHCHYLISVENTDLGMPEVTLPVLPGMEMCHWPFRKTDSENWPKLLRLLLIGHTIKAKEATGWLIDYTGSMDEVLQMVWKTANEGAGVLPQRKVEEERLIRRFLDVVK